MDRFLPWTTVTSETQLEDETHTEETDLRIDWALQKYRQISTKDLQFYASGSPLR